MLLLVSSDLVSQFTRTEHCVIISEICVVLVVVMVVVVVWY